MNLLEASFASVRYLGGEREPSRKNKVMITLDTM